MDNPKNDPLVRCQTVKARFRELARTTPTLAEAVRAAFAAFPAVCEREKLDHTIDSEGLARLSDEDYNTVGLFWLGLLADAGSDRPVVPRPRGTDSPGRAPYSAPFVEAVDAAIYRRLRFDSAHVRVPPDSRTQDQDELRADVAESMLRHVEQRYVGGGREPTRAGAGESEAMATGTGGANRKRRRGTRKISDKVVALLTGPEPYEGTKTDLAKDAGYTQPSALAHVKRFSHLWDENERKLAARKAERERRMRTAS